MYNLYLPSTKSVKRSCYLEKISLGGNYFLNSAMYFQFCLHYKYQVSLRYTSTCIELILMKIKENTCTMNISYVHYIFIFLMTSLSRGVI